MSGHHERCLVKKFLGMIIVQFEKIFRNYIGEIINNHFAQLIIYLRLKPFEISNRKEFKISKEFLNEKEINLNKK